jgi:hypothetical protein
VTTKETIHAIELCDKISTEQKSRNEDEEIKSRSNPGLSLNHDVSDDWYNDQGNARIKGKEP